MKHASVLSAFRNLGLTAREAEVLLWIARGESNAEIGRSLRISPRTVKKHLEHIFRKLGVKTRLAAAVYVGPVCATPSVASSQTTHRLRKADSGAAISSVRALSGPLRSEAQVQDCLPE